MILDKDGNPIEPERHRFGMFNIPEDVRITKFSDYIKVEDIQRGFLTVDDARRSDSIEVE